MLLIYAVEAGKEKQHMEARAIELIDTVKPQLLKSLWDFDERSTQLLLDSLEQSLFFSFVKLEEVSANIEEHSDVVVALKFQDENLGYLVANYNYQEIQEIIFDRLKSTSYVLFSVVVLTGFLFYLLVNHFLIKHIVEIGKSKYNKFYHSLEEFEPVKLSRKNHDDELSELVETLNTGRKQSIELFQAKKDYQNQMEYQANFDLLTGLPNRRHLDNYLKLQVEQYQDTMGQLVVMFIDLDGFKQVNDSLGHGIGDMVLKESAERIKSVVDKFDGYVSRLGGDEFIACFYAENLKVSDVAARNLIDIFTKKVECQDIHVRLGCSIGITLYPEHHVENAKQLIRNADNALYEAKAAGKNTFFCFNKELLDDYILKQKIADKLPEAIEKEVFDVYFQPLINIEKEVVVGFEALIRWTDPELGFVRPDIFISIAEKMGCVFDIDTFVFKKAMNQVEKWRLEYKQDFIISINFSPTNFYHSNFFTWLKNDLSTLNKGLSWVELEVTERLMLNSDPIVAEGIRELRKKGIKFSIDDFGIGYSSLGYIKKFSGIFSKIKIDRLFINEILTGGFDVAFVKSIMMLADSLNMQVLAEGVEESEQVDMLKSLGCQYVQGYYYSRPLPANEVEEFLNLKCIDGGLLNMGSIHPGQDRAAL